MFWNLKKLQALESRVKGSFPSPCPTCGIILSGHLGSLNRQLLNYNVHTHFQLLDNKFYIISQSSNFNLEIKIPIMIILISNGKITLQGSILQKLQKQTFRNLKKVKLCSFHPRLTYLKKITRINLPLISKYACICWEKGHLLVAVHPVLAKNYFFLQRHRFSRCGCWARDHLSKP